MTDFFKKNIVNPIERFLALQESSGIVLSGAFVLALLFANTFLSSTYEAILHWPLSLNLGQYKISMSLHHLVNDGLMVIFFFVVGLEIKQELVSGSLSSKKLACLPFVAALGGMVVPALTYLFFNHSGDSVIGWGIPMATDIAFAIGVLAFVSKRVPFPLKIFLLALATIDDLGAVLVIASFYSSKIAGFWLASSGICILLLFVLRKLQVHNYLIYLLGGLTLWFCVLQSGIHATIAGVILGLMTPVYPLGRNKHISQKMKDLLSNNQLTSTQIESMKQNLQSLQSPTQLLMDRLHRWVVFVIMPIFAFFNGGVRLGEEFVMTEFVMSPVAQGIFLGLLFGKPVGIFLFSWLAVKWNWAEWPKETRPIHILGIGFLAGIGFTMALFISSLSLQFDFVLENYSKAAIFVASLLAGIIGFLILFFCGRNKTST